MPSKNKSLIARGLRRLDGETPLVKQLRKPNNGVSLVSLLDKCARNLSEEQFYALVRFLKFKPDIAMSLLLFYGHEEVREKYKNFPIKKQFQIGMKHFCLRKRSWSRRDREIEREASKKLPLMYCPDELLEELKPYYEIASNQWRKHRSIQWMPPYDNLLKRCPGIWFIEDELLESLILSIKAFPYDIFFLAKINHPKGQELSYAIQGEAYTERITATLREKLEKGEDSECLTLGEWLFFFAYHY